MLERSRRSREFERVFGSRPSRANPGYRRLGDIYLRALQAQWDGRSRRFVRVVRRGEQVLDELVGGDGARKLAEAIDVYRAWSMGDPVVYLYRLSGGVTLIRCRWPNSLRPEMTTDAETALCYPHEIVARYQRQLRDEGLWDQRSMRLHPLLGGSLLGEDGDC